jgi:hypothetical protein
MEITTSTVLIFSFIIHNNIILMHNGEHRANHSKIAVYAAHGEHGANDDECNFFICSTWRTWSK